jgi:hypothetical protein
LGSCFAATWLGAGAFGGGSKGLVPAALAKAKSSLPCNSCLFSNLLSLLVFLGSLDSSLLELLLLELLLLLGGAWPLFALLMAL